MSKDSRLLRRVLLLLGCIVVFVIVSGFGYQMGMLHLEGKERTYLRSVLTVFESLTTTGYGWDGNWEHPAMGLYMLFLQVAGLFFFILAFPIYVVPFLETHFEQRLPTSAADIEDHVLIYKSSTAIVALLPQLEQAEHPFLVMEDDETEGRKIVDRKYRVVQCEPNEDGLRGAGLMRARAVIANGSDVENVSLALTARQLGYQGDLIAIVTDPTYLEHMKLVGCTDVLTPRYLLAGALAARASDRVSPTVAGAHQLGAQLQVRQIRIQPESDLAGQDLNTAAIGSRTGAIVLGQWVGGKLRMAAGADMVIQPRGILVVAGSHSSINNLSRIAEGTGHSRVRGGIVVIGFGEVGVQVVKMLRKAGEKVMVVDRIPAEGVDLVGDILDPDLLEQAAISEAKAVILAIDSDSSTLFATVIIRDRWERVPILARVNKTDNLEKIHRAGVDYALSFSQVAGSLLSSRLLGKQSYELDPQFSLLKLTVQELDGQKPAEMDIRGKTGCSIVALVRHGVIFTRFDEEFGFESEDEVYICGSHEGLEKFEKIFGQ
ncbi:MAG: hypothetical protein GY835_16050 [bacterium]|nr:hypothetical protein [bacterium]